MAIPSRNVETSFFSFSDIIFLFTWNILHICLLFWVLLMATSKQKQHFHCLVPCHVHLSIRNYINSCASSFQVKKHIKQGEGHTGGIFSIEAPLHVSNVQVVDPVTGYGYDTWSCFSAYRYIAFLTSHYKFNTTFHAGNRVKLDISIWKMGPKSDSLEAWMHLVLWYPGQKFWRREENQGPHHVCLIYFWTLIIWWSTSCTLGAISVQERELWFNKVMSK
jgi:hypothetical protein